MSLVPFADAKAWLGITDPDDDSKLQDALDAAEAYIAREIGVGTQLAAQAITQRARGLGRSLVLTSLPVLSVTSVTDSQGHALTVGSLDVDRENGLIYYDTLGSTVFPMPWYTVVYQSGFSTLSDDYVQAVKNLLRVFWAPQRGNKAAASDADRAAAMAAADMYIDRLASPLGFA